MPQSAYELSAKGRALLRVIVAEIRSGRIIAGDRHSFLPYSEALAALGHPNPHEFSGRRLQREGLPTSTNGPRHQREFLTSAD